MNWSAFDGGRSIGTVGSERGVIVRDEEHSGGARITLEQNTTITLYAITCGIYGWMVHTRYFTTDDEAKSAFESMSAELSRIVGVIPLKADPDFEAKSPSVRSEISNFVKRFP